MHPVRTVRPSDPALILQSGPSFDIPRASGSSAFMQNQLTSQQQRLGHRYDPLRREPQILPTCLSLDRKSDVPMVPSHNAGWELWQHPKNAEKRFWRAEKAGARIGFEISTTVGEVYVQCFQPSCDKS